MGNDDSWVGRRFALRVIGVGGLGASLSLAACGGEESDDEGSQESGPSCSSPIDAQSQQLRTNLQYVDQSTIEGRTCANCAQYTADTFGDCGGCNVFSGPVQPNGYCLSWAAIQEDAPDEAAPSEEAAEKG